MFVPSVYDIIETVNSFFEILIVAFFIIAFLRENIIRLLSTL